MRAFPSFTRFSCVRRAGYLLNPAGRGLPGGNSLFFASPKKSKQKKGDPAVCVPSLRYGQPAVLGSGGVSLNSLRSNNAIPDPPEPALLGAYRRGGGRNTNSRTQNPEYLKKQGHAMACPCGYWFSCLRTSPRPGWAEQRRWRRDQGRSCLSEASSADPRRSRAAQVARSEAQGPRLRVAFSLLTFFWRSKRKLLAAGQPPASGPQQRAQSLEQKQPS